jgi:hypothetical protein
MNIPFLSSPEYNQQKQVLREVQVNDRWVQYDLITIVKEDEPITHRAGYDLIIDGFHPHRINGVMRRHERFYCYVLDKWIEPEYLAFWKFSR